MTLYFSAEMQASFLMPYMCTGENGPGMVMPAKFFLQCMSFWSHWLQWGRTAENYWNVSAHSFMDIHRYVFSEVQDMLLIHLWWGRRHTTGIFSSPVKQLCLKDWLPGAVSKPCTSTLHSQQHGTETTMPCCSPQYCSFFGVRNR